ncbi:MAG TPA: transglutaminaseTgpA domain-containing protein, partial [Gaiella sp.]|nr:transglutaminaseTgpA domain-containing protein [Gaiella sp.]
MAEPADFRPDLRGVVAAVPVVATAMVAWALLEEPVAWWTFAACGALAVLPTAARATGPRALLTVAAALLALTVAFKSWPHRGLDDAWTALHDAPAVRAPFDPAAYPSLHGLVVVVAFAVALAGALGAASRRVGIVVAAVAVGVGFPARLLEDENAIALGALALGAVLWTSLVFSLREPRRTVPGAALGALVLAAAVAVTTTGVAPGQARVDWRGWDPFAGSGRTASLRYLWDAHYGGIDFPARPTVVLRVRAPKRAEYWRVSTLETFAADRWIENLYPIDIGAPHRVLPRDPLVPQRDAQPRRWLEQVVTVEGLEDDRIAAASQPARVDGESLGRVSFLAGGVMRAGRTVRRGAEYTVWSYAPRPTPRALAASRPRYPEDAGRYLELGRARFPGFGAPNRERRIDRLFTDDRYQPLWSYRPLWEEAQRRTRRARSPYEATLLLERWFRSEGGFRYDEHPPQSAGLPPLVDFVEVTKLGYCQHYAGAMAVMLRLLGVPSRVAVGFTAGTWKAGVWTVTDHQAHAWVEAWFDGFGWLAFDPTPGRGTLSAVYTLASDSADAVRALGTGRFLDFTPPEPDAGRPTATASAPPAENGSLPWWLVALPLIPLAAIAVVVGTKAARRSRRLRRRDPKALARGVRAELAAALVDRGAALAPAMTTSDLRRTTERVLGLPAGALTDALAQARFGRSSDARAAARRARAELANVLGAARARETPGERLRAALSLRSLTR